MIYLDYAAHTPVCDAVLDAFCEACRRYTANPNSSHAPGREAKRKILESTAHITELLRWDDEIIFTSSASEANNLAIKGLCRPYRKYGKHIVTTYLEHSSVNGAVGALVQDGWEVEYVNLTDSGQVDLEHLREILRDDTVLVSVCLVDSEIGMIQQTDRIAEIVKDRPHCFFHVDATQAVGKVPVIFDGVDLVTFAPHKFYGLVGCGVLLKKQNILLVPLIHGGISNTPYRSGTPDIGQIVAADIALSLALKALDEHNSAVFHLNKLLKQGLNSFQNVRMNSPNDASPYIVNISIPGVNTERMKSYFDEQEVYLSTKSACCAPNTVSRPVFALTKDKKTALSTLRISLSHLTTEQEIATFLELFDKGYRKFAE